MNILKYLEQKSGFIEIAKIGFQDPKIGEWYELSNGVCVRQTTHSVLEIRPPKPSDISMVYSCGIHGNETAPIEIVSQLLHEVATEQILPTTNILFVLGNPKAMNIGQRFVSINMNRLFAGAWQNYELSAESEWEINRAAELEQLLTQFFDSTRAKKKYHFDCHTAIKPSYHKTFAIRPWQQGELSSNSAKLLKAMGIEAILQHNKPSTTFSYYSVDAFGAEAYTLELGKVKPFGENNIDDFAAATTTLRQLITGDSITGGSIAENQNHDPIEYKVVAEILKHSEQFKMLVDDQAPNFTPYPQGTLIASDQDFEYRVAFSEEAVVFPNVDVPIGQRVAVMVSRR